MKNFWYTILGVGLGVVGTVAFGKRKEIGNVVGSAYKAGVEKFHSCCEKGTTEPVNE